VKISTLKYTVYLSAYTVSYPYFSACITKRTLLFAILSNCTYCGWGTLELTSASWALSLIFCLNPSELSGYFYTFSFNIKEVLSCDVGQHFCV
jgi:hypothetical protein